MQIHEQTFLMILYNAFLCWLTSKSGFGDMIPEAEGLLDVSEYANSLHDIIEKSIQSNKNCHDVTGGRLKLW